MTKTHVLINILCIPGTIFYLKKTSIDSGIFPDILTADYFTPCVATPASNMVLIENDKPDSIFQDEVFQLPLPSLAPFTNIG